MATETTTPTLLPCAACGEDTPSAEPICAECRQAADSLEIDCADCDGTAGEWQVAGAHWVVCPAGCNEGRVEAPFLLERAYASGEAWAIAIYADARKAMQPEPSTSTPAVAGLAA